MTTWCVFVSRCGWDAFAGKLVDHLSNSVCVVGGWDYEEEVPGIGPARALCFERGFELSLIVAMLLFASGCPCTGGFCSIITITLLG